MGKVIEVLLRNDVLLVDEIGFAPLDDTGAQRSGRRRHLRTPLPGHRLAPSRTGADSPEHTTAVSMLDRLLHHATTVVTNGQSYRMLQARQRRGGPPLTP